MSKGLCLPQHQQVDGSSSSNVVSVRSSCLATVSRLCGLFLILLMTALSIRSRNVNATFLRNFLMDNNTQEPDYFDKCFPGGFRGPDLLQYRLWVSPLSYSSTETVSLPIYSSHDLDTVNKAIKKVVIIQHGNLRNANAYFCGTIDSLKQINSENVDTNEYLIIAPQFLVDDDVCWDSVTGQRLTVKVSSGITCGHPIYTSEGWKDGLSAQYASLNSATPVYSYDVFNLLINRVGDGVTFPSVNDIVLVGFSAGAQTILRYSFLPAYTVSIPHVNVRYVVSDPSTYLYMTNLRFMTDKPSSRGQPDRTWIPDAWKVDSNGQPWIVNWESDCVGYNTWRFGFDSMSGYAAHYFQAQNYSEAFKLKLIREFLQREVLHVVGMADSMNCKLNGFPGCNDNELAINCPAMLQGDNRLSRFFRYRQHILDVAISDWLYSDINSMLPSLYSSSPAAAAANSRTTASLPTFPSHGLVYVPGLGHDPIAMLHSAEARCAIFRIGCPAESRILLLHEDILPPIDHQPIHR